MKVSAVLKNKYNEHEITVTSNYTDEIAEIHKTLRLGLNISLIK